MPSDKSDPYSSMNNANVLMLPDSGSPLQSCSFASVANSIAAGYVAGICGVVIGHPLDSIKVLLQTESKSLPFGSSAQMSTSQAAGGLSATAINPCASPSVGTVINRPVASSFSATVGTTSVVAPAQNGPSTAKICTLTSSAANQMQSGGSMKTKRSLRMLYSGKSGPLLTAGLIHSTNFAIYDTIRRVLYKHTNPTEPKDEYLFNDSYFSVALASGIAGGVISFMTSPLMIVKTKQQILVCDFKRAIVGTYRGEAQAGRIGMQGSRSGFQNFFVGFGPHFYCDAFGRAFYFASYELYKRNILILRNSCDDAPERIESPHITLPERMTCAFFADMTCWALIFPADVIRSRMYAQTLSHERQTALELTKALYYGSGKSLKPFFRGFGASVIRAGPVAATVLPVYDKTLEWLSGE